jgi:hypothetical protein
VTLLGSPLSPESATAFFPSGIWKLEEEGGLVPGLLPYFPTSKRSNIVLAGRKRPIDPNQAIGLNRNRQLVSHTHQIGHVRKSLPAWALPRLKHLTMDTVNRNKQDIIVLETTEDDLELFHFGDPKGVSSRFLPDVFFVPIPVAGHLPFQWV